MNTVSALHASALFDRFAMATANAVISLNLRSVGMGVFPTKIASSRICSVTPFTLTLKTELDEFPAASLAMQ
jgi:hypothetical protein